MILLSLLAFIVGLMPQDVSTLVGIFTDHTLPLEQRLEAFQKIHQPSAEVRLGDILPVYMEVLQNPAEPDDIRTAVVSGLLATIMVTGEGRGSLRAAVPAFVDCLKSENVKLRKNCALGLVWVEPPLPKEVFPTIVEAAKDASWPTNRHLVVVLAAFELPPDQIIGALLELLEAEPLDSVIIPALLAIQRERLYSPQLVPYLVSLAGNRSFTQIRFASLSLLGSLGSKGADALPVLRSIASDPTESDSTRKAVSEAISRIEGTSGRNCRNEAQ